MTAPALDLPRGLWGTILLPVDARDQIDWSALSDELDLLVHSGLHGIYANGTAGEFHNQTDAEYERLVDLVARKARGAGMPFQIGVSCTNARVARERLRALRDVRPSAAQFILPDWWAPSQPELHAFLAGMQEVACGIPLVLYNPPQSKLRLDLDQIAALRAQYPLLVGAKLPGGDAGWYARRRALLPGFSVFVPGHTVAFGRPLGADGAYSNVACLGPRGALLHWQLSAESPERAGELESRIQQFMARYVLPLVQTHGLAHPALDKMMAEVGAWGPVRARMLWPHASAPDAAIRDARAALRDMLPEFC
ncbi:MAG: dihydrodipicolinate synthase family protein [Rhodoferax sp.]|nr:dihydrodipicolinate synthase family protein [Rhodoferax sp.]